MSAQTTTAIQSSSGGIFAFLNNFRIGPKIIAGYIILILLMGGVTGAAYWGMGRIDAADHLALKRQEDTAHLWAMQSNLIEQYAHMADLIINDDPATIEAFQANVEEMDQNKEHARTSVDTDDERQWMAEIDRLDAQFDSLFINQVAPAWEAGDEKQLKELDNQADALIAQMQERTEKMIASYEAEVKEANSAAEEMYNQTILLMLAISIGAAFAGLVFGFFLSRVISIPVQVATAAATRLAQGDVNQELAVTSRDEIGQMAEAFRQMISYQQQMAAVAACLAQGDVSVHVNPQSDKDVLGHAFRQMIIYQQQMAQVAGQMARGDLTATITPQSNQDALGNAFSQMIAYQQQMAGAAGRLAEGNMNVSVTPQSDQDALGNAFSRMIVYQQQMAEVAGCLAQGDLTTAITPQSDQDALGNAFRQMILNLRDLISQVADTANTVGVASAQLSTAAEQAGQATQQVTATIQQIAQGTTQQTQAVTETTGNVQQIARASEGIARGAQEQAQGITKTSDLTVEMAAIVTQVGATARSVNEANVKVTQAARLGVSAVGQTGQGMDAIRSRTLAAADKVKDMGNRSKEIGRIIETIDDIADKTDMLALNAAVEAARAGEYGRGFAVVADQVRKLSEDSKAATRDIGQLIERVQDTIREAVAAMDSTVAEVDNGARLTGDTTRSLQEILLAAENAATLAEQIATAVNQLKQKSEGVVSAMETVTAVVEENTAVAEEMAASSQEVTMAMEGVAGVAEENSAAAEEVSASAEEMSAQVEEVVASAQELSSLAEQLREAVAQFRVEESRPVQSQPGQRRMLQRSSTGGQYHHPVTSVRVHQSNGQK